MGLDAGFVDRATPGSQIFRGCEANGRSSDSAAIDRNRIIGKRDDALDRSFAEGGFTDDEGTPQIFERACDDFGCAGRGGIDENDNREGAVAAALLECGINPVRSAALGHDDRSIRRKELTADINGAGEESARVVAQVEDESLHAFGFEVVEGGIQLRRSGFVELTDPHIADPEVSGFAGWQEAGFADAFDFYDRPLDREFEDVVAFRALEGECDFFADLSAEEIHRFREGESVGGFTIDFEDAVAGEKSRFEGRSSFDGRDNDEESVAHADLNAESAEFTASVLLHGLEALRVEKLAVRIEFRQHAAQGTVGEGAEICFILVHIFRLDELNRRGQETHVGKGRLVFDGDGFLDLCRSRGDQKRGRKQDERRYLEQTGKE